MTIDDLIEQLVTDLEFDALIIWADILGVEVNYPPLKEMWPDWECELRQKVGDAMAQVGLKKRSDLHIN